MSKKSIIIIIVCTLIFIAASIATVYREPAIEAIYFSEQKILSGEELAKQSPYVFDSQAQDIYLIMEVKYLSPTHEIQVLWEQYDQQEYHTVQQDTLNPQEQGSGFITVTMAKRDGRIPEGRYRVVAVLNHKQRVTEYFEVQ